MKTQKTKVHFTDNYLIDPTNPITVHLIGTGGTGSQVLTGLAKMNHALNELGHAGVQVTLWDDDTVEQANLGRQLFAECELGLFKTVALVNRTNRFFGTDWKAQTFKFERDTLGRLPEQASATMFISCVDTVSARFGITDILTELKGERHHRDQAKYWMDFGNSQFRAAPLSFFGKNSERKAVQPHSALFLHSILPWLNTPKRGCDIFNLILKSCLICPIEYKKSYRRYSYPK